MRAAPWLCGALIKLPLLCAAAPSASVLPSELRDTAAATTSWGHSWDTAGAAWWGDFGYSLLTETQAQFIAENYFLASLEKCTGRSAGLSTEEGIYQTARQLKKHNPKVKTTFYWHTGQAGIGCYAANATFMAHKDWWLRDDNGNIVGHKDSTHPAGQPRIDWTNEEAVAWWVSVPLGGAGADELIDGVLADGAGFEMIPNITMPRLQKLCVLRFSSSQTTVAARRLELLGQSLTVVSFPYVHPSQVHSEACHARKAPGGVRQGRERRRCLREWAVRV